MSSARNSARMFAIRLHAPGTLDDLVLEQVEIPRAGSGEALVRVHAAAITRDELAWPVDRLPAIPSYELSGTIEAVGSDVSDLAVGDAVWALIGFDRDGAAAEYTLVPATVLAPKPRTLGHVESAAIPLAGPTAWQGLFEHGRLREGERVLIHGAAGGVGQFATQLAHQRGAYVIGTSSSAAAKEVLTLGADEAFDRTSLPARRGARCVRARPDARQARQGRAPDRRRLARDRATDTVRAILYCRWATTPRRPRRSVSLGNTTLRLQARS